MHKSPTTSPEGQASLASVTNAADVGGPELQDWHNAVRACRSAALDDVNVRAATAVGETQRSG